MSYQRIDRISEEVRREVDRIIREELNDPRISGTFSVTRADVTRDLRYAKIYVSVFPFDKHPQLLATLEENNWFIRRQLGQRIRNQLKVVPELQFFLDDSLEYIDHIEEALNR